jgi:hypothetical protein
MSILAPAFENLNTYYQSYWNHLSPGEDMLKALADQQIATEKWLSLLPEHAGELVYQPGKWMLKEVIGHLCDAERILSYRALRFARFDDTELHGFDENDFTRASNYAARTLSDISHEWNTIREATITLFTNMSPEALDHTGVANGTKVTPRIILYFILVHQRHHLQIIKDRYLKAELSA